MFNVAEMNEQRSLFLYKEGMKSSFTSWRKSHRECDQLLQAQLSQGLLNKECPQRVGEEEEEGCSEKEMEEGQGFFFSSQCPFIADGFSALQGRCFLGHWKKKSIYFFQLFRNWLKIGQVEHWYDNVEVFRSSIYVSSHADDDITVTLNNVNYVADVQPTEVNAKWTSLCLHWQFYFYLCTDSQHITFS